MNKAQNKVEIRFMKQEDCKAIAQIERICFSNPWSEQSFLDTLGKKDIFYLIAERTEEGKKQLIGYIGVWQFFEEADITNIAVLPEERKKGIGYLLLEKMMKEAARRGVTALALEVRESNQTAIWLYKKAGFVVEGIRANYYEKPKENALLMWNRSLRGITIEKQKNYPV